MTPKEKEVKLWEKIDQLTEKIDRVLKLLEAKDVKRKK